MRVVDAEGQFVGFVRGIAGQNLVIGRPSTTDIQIPKATCEMTADKVKLGLYRREMVKMGHREQDDWDFNRFNR